MLGIAMCAGAADAGASFDEAVLPSRRFIPHSGPCNTQPEFDSYECKTTAMSMSHFWRMPCWLGEGKRETKRTSPLLVSFGTNLRAGCLKNWEKSTGGDV